MKRHLIVVLAAAAALALPAAVLASPGPHLSTGQELGSSACGHGKLVVNVKQEVRNDIDSGVAGNYWAYDNLNRQIQVRQTGADTFCATVQYEGQFTTVAGTSPQNTGLVSDGITGTFNGGYWSTIFTATFDPSAPTHGNIGTFDYQCDVATGDCGGYVDWTTLYFTGVSNFDLAWWGWIYHAGNNGSWVNSIDGNEGDISG